MSEGTGTDHEAGAHPTALNLSEIQEVQREESIFCGASYRRPCAQEMRPGISATPDNVNYRRESLGLSAPPKPFLNRGAGNRHHFLSAQGRQGLL